MNEILLILIISYLLGSIPTGYLVGKYIKNIDLRKVGSGSTGATNVLRNVGKWPALFVFLIDVAKGFAAVKVTDIFISNTQITLLAGLLAISGHIWPIWLKGKGGKAVATGLGFFLALSWEVGLSALGIFLLILKFSRIVSLSSISAAICLPLLMFFHYGQVNHPYTLISALVSLVVIWKHKTNIIRLSKGSEPKINNKL